jgi:hypothetical protein
VKAEFEIEIKDIAIGWLLIVKETLDVVRFEEVNESISYGKVQVMEVVVVV